MKSILLIVLVVAAAVDGTSLGRRRIYRDESSERRVMCYYGSWAVYRPGLGKFDVEQIDPFICTHVIYAFAGLSSFTYEMISLDPYNDIYDNNGKGAFERFTGLSKINPKLKCLLGIGGWNEGSTKYSEMANDPGRRAHFVQTVVPFLKKYGFHGLDMDWEYPTQNGGKPTDKRAFVELLKELKAAFEPDGLLLSAAVSAGKDNIDAAYDVPEVVNYLDFLNLMTYDFHGTWESSTGHNAPLYPRPDETPYQHFLNVNFSANYWIEKGASAGKINLGMAAYGINFALSDPAKHDLYAQTKGPGRAGPYTKRAGTPGYNEICVDLIEGGWTVEVDPYYKAPYAYKDSQWVAYDDMTSIEEKCKLANQLNLGGVMIWSIETDDFQPTCGSQKFPLLSVINKFIRGISTNVNALPPPTTTPYTGSPTTPAPTQRPVQYPPPLVVDYPTTTRPTNKSPAMIPAPTQYSARPPTPRGVCNYPGFQADPDDCTTFYDCIPNGFGSYAMFTFHCFGGDVFDPVIGSCNFAAFVPDCHADIWKWHWHVHKWKV